MSDCTPEFWTLKDIQTSLEKEYNGKKKIVIPMFQRGKRWDKNKKETFIDSLRKKYPIGTLLFYKTNEGDQEIYTLIDGLQRGTAIKEYLANPSKFFTIKDFSNETMDKIYNLIVCSGNVEAQKNQINQKIEEYTSKIESNEEASELLDEELNKSRLLLGLTNVTGDGVVITLTDNDSEKITATDIVELVNELRYAGAEAISVNDVRVVNMTEFADIYGYIIMKPSQRITSPYVIKAIGSQTQLINTLSIKETGFIDYRTSQGKTVKLEKQRNIKYTGEIEVRYMKEVED